MPYFKYEKSATEPDRINRIDPDGGVQFVAECRNPYYTKLFIAALQFETKELAQLLALVHNQGADWKGIFDKINSLLCDRTQDWNE